MVQPSLLDPPARRIPLDGPVNFRDLGGYRNGDGREVRWRRVFRADGLESMTGRDLEVVVESLGVRVVIDLRTDREIGLVGTGPVREAVEWHNVSIIDETKRVWKDAVERGSIVDQYFAMLDGSSGRFVEALELIAGTGEPLVFHCAAGKDRTGLLAALLLSLLGVSDDVIGHDYGITREVLPALEARFLARAEDPRYQAHYDRRPGWKESARAMMTADPLTLGEVIAGLRARHGSPEAWLVEHGLSPNVVQVLRDQLLA